MHTDEAPKMEAPKSTSSANLTLTETPTGKEVYTSGASNIPTSTAAVAVAPPPPVIEAEDDLSIPVKVGTPCQRKGCAVAFETDEINRIGDGKGTVCTYHPAPVSPTRNYFQYLSQIAIAIIQRRKQGVSIGSVDKAFLTLEQGYLCCKRRVLGTSPSFPHPVSLCSLTAN